jgi:hypothetical protein
MPTAAALPVSSAISQSWAIRYIHRPVLATSWEQK